MMDFETDDTTEYLFDDAPTTEWNPVATAGDEWDGEQETRAESPRAKRI